MTSHHYLEKEITQSKNYDCRSLDGISSFICHQQAKIQKIKKVGNPKYHWINWINSFEKQRQINIRSQLSLLCYNNNLNPKNASKHSHFFSLSEYCFFCSNHSSIVKPTKSQKNWFFNHYCLYVAVEFTILTKRHEKKTDWNHFLVGMTNSANNQHMSKFIRDRFGFAFVFFFLFLSYL